MIYHKNIVVFKYPQIGFTAYTAGFIILSADH